jgi:hypothetical protein
MPYIKKSDKPSKKKLTAADQQEREIVEVANLVGDAWGAWGGPSLVIDFETTTDLKQAIRFGVFQLRGYDFLEIIELTKTKQATRSNLDRLWYEGIAYSETECKPGEIALMHEYAAKHNMLCMTIDDFKTKIFYKVYSAKAKRWEMNGDKSYPVNQIPPLIIGHNLPFDLGRMAVRFNAAKGFNYGGLTLTIKEGCPNITIKKIGFGKHLYGTNLQNDRKSLLFLNTQQVGRALLGASVQSSLVGLAGALGVKTIRLPNITDELNVEVLKASADYEGEINENYLLYCRGDVETTWQTYLKLRDLYDKHGFTKTKDNGFPARPIWAIASEASVGKAYLEQLEIKSFRQNHTMWEHAKYSALFMAGMYGGRTEVNTRLQIRRGMQGDFKSEYTTLNALMNMRELNTAQKIDFKEGDGSVSDKAAQFLRTITLEQLQKPETWPLLRGAAFIDPTGCILPIRTEYEVGVYDKEKNETIPEYAKQIGVNEIGSAPPTWYLFPHIVASILLNGHIPKIYKTVTFDPTGTQHGLAPHPFFGDKEFMIDARKDDPCKTFIDMRTKIKDEKKEGWEPKEQSLKLMSSATSYGALVEFTVDERVNDKGLSINMCVWTPHGCDIQEASKPHISETCDSEDYGLKIERPGKWFAPWGPIIPAGGQLLLAIAERLSRDAGLDRGFCDTDSSFFLIPDGMSEDVFSKKAIAICEWFQPLTPYNDKTSPLFALEDVNFALLRDDKGEILRDNKGKPLLCDGKKGRPLTYELPYLLAVSAKRYAIANRYNGEWIIRKASGHGSGDITAPFYDNSYLPDHPAAPFKDGEYQSKTICKSQAPKLLLDLWRFVFETVERHKPKHGDLEAYLLDKCQKFIDKLPGLDKPQMVQQSICSRDELKTHKDKPWSYPFGFYNSISKPVPVKPIDQPIFQILNDEQMSDRRELCNTALITYGGKKHEISTCEEYLARGEGKEGLHRRDNGRFPREMFDPKYHVRFRTTGEQLYWYFVHPEFKSVGKYGALKRRKVYILDNVYVGKETSSIIHNMEDDAFDEEDYLNRNLSRNTNINWRLIDKFKPNDVAKALGISMAIYKKLYARGVLSPEQLDRLRQCINVEDDGSVAFIIPPPKSTMEKLSERLRRRLNLLRKKLSKVGAVASWEDVANLTASSVVINPEFGIETERDLEKRKTPVVRYVRELLSGEQLTEMPGLKKPYAFFEDAIKRACGEYEKDTRIQMVRKKKDQQKENDRRRDKRTAKRSAIDSVTIPKVFYDDPINGAEIIMPPTHRKYKHAVTVARRAALKMPDELASETFKVELKKAISEFGGWFGQENPPPD